MQYQFSGKLKSISLALIVLGALLFGVGLYFNHQDKCSDFEDIVHHMEEEHPEYFQGEHPSEEYSAINHTPEAHKKHLEHYHNQIGNRPWAAFLVPAYLFFGIAAAAMFFLAIQNVAHAGWSIVVIRVMESIASFLPIGAVLVLIVLVTAALTGEFHLGTNNLYHWMHHDLKDPNSENFDIFLRSKHGWLNVPFWLVRAVIYMGSMVIMFFIVKKVGEKLDAHPLDAKIYTNLYNKSVGYIVVFALFSAAMAWDFIMSIDPHWYSSLFMWYNMVSYLVVALSFMAMISIYLKKLGHLPDFNDNHQHDLAKYMFGFSLLWSYLWVCQFLLQWYANIPEEVQYFQQRHAQYPLYHWMLIPNLLLPLLVLISSSIKRNSTVVMVMGFVIFIGHFWDMYNQIMPGSVGAFHNLGFLEIGALFLISGLFIYFVFKYISRTNLEMKGHPMYHESKIYEYPF